ncbi:unnamed protein product, partial [Lymnaea stagnalis]
DILVSSLGGAREMTQLHGVLFENYSKNVRPCLNYSQPTRVNVTLYVATIVGLDIKNQILKLSGYLSFEWQDELLLWNPAHYGDIDSILVPQDMIWRPDVAVYNSVEERVYVGEDGSLASVSYDGLVRWEPVINLGVTCKVDISKYPFDENICTINVTAWMSDNGTVQLTLTENPVRLDNMMTNGEYIVSPYTSGPQFTFFNGKHYIVMGFRLLLKRRPDYLTMTLLLPVTMLAVLCVVSYLLSPEEPEKVSVSITVLLSFSVFLGIIDNDLPESSDNLSFIVYYVVLLLLLAFFCVAGNAVVVVVHTRDLKRQAPPTVVKIDQSDAHDMLGRGNYTNGDDLIHVPDGKRGHRKSTGIDVIDVAGEGASVLSKTAHHTRAERLNRFFFLLNTVALIVVVTAITLLILY